MPALHHYSRRTAWQKIKWMERWQKRNFMETITTKGHPFLYQISFHLWGIFTASTSPRLWSQRWKIWRKCTQVYLLPTIRKGTIYPWQRKIFRQGIYPLFLGFLTGSGKEAGKRRRKKRALRGGRHPQGPDYYSFFVAPQEKLKSAERKILFCQNISVTHLQFRHKKLLIRFWNLHRLHCLLRCPFHSFHKVPN